MSNTPIKWRLRRGMLELDYVLLSFYDACYEDLTAAQKHSFSLLLEEPDPLLLEWLIYREPCEQQFFEIINLIHEYIDTSKK